MGTDVHGGFVVLNSDGSKTKIEHNWEMDRNYTLFAILAGVRNGYGFAGAYRHEPLVPVAEGRGIPSWITLMYVTDGSDDEDEIAETFDNHTSDIYSKYKGEDWFDGDPEVEWLGEHSHTYMTADEILDWPHWDKKLKRGGVVDIEHYRETIAKDENPEYWSGGIWGKDIVVANEGELIGDIPADVTHIKASWEDKKSLKEHYQWFIDEVQRLKDLHQKDGSVVYLVIGFDS